MVRRGLLTLAAGDAQEEGVLGGHGNGRRGRAQSQGLGGDGLPQNAERWERMGAADLPDWPMAEWPAVNVVAMTCVYV